MRLSSRMRPGVESAPWVVDEVRRMEVEIDRLRHALKTIEISGAPGASIMAKRMDDHACSWCRGMWTPCPTSTASNALHGEKP